MEIGPEIFRFLKIREAVINGWLVRPPYMTPDRDAQKAEPDEEQNDRKRPSPLVIARSCGQSLPPRREWMFRK